MLSIYPIVDGQKLDGNLVIPPRKESGPTAIPVEAPESSNSSSDNVAAEAPIAVPVSVPAAVPVAVPAAVVEEEKLPSEIADLLQSTGKPAEAGPLLSFTDEMKKDLPNAKQ